MTTIPEFKIYLLSSGIIIINLTMLNICSKHVSSNKQKIQSKHFMKFYALKWHIQHAREDKVHVIKYLANQY